MEDRASRQIGHLIKSDEGDRKRKRERERERQGEKGGQKSEMKDLISTKNISVGIELTGRCCRIFCPLSVEQ
jgi:hypothetical protein